MPVAATGLWRLALIFQPVKESVAEIFSIAYFLANWAFIGVFIFVFARGTEYFCEEFWRTRLSKFALECVVRICISKTCISSFVSHPCDGLKPAISVEACSSSGGSHFWTLPWRELGSKGCWSWGFGDHWLTRTSKRKSLACWPSPKKKAVPQCLTGNSEWDAPSL